MSLHTILIHMTLVSNLYVRHVILTVTLHFTFIETPLYLFLASIEPTQSHPKNCFQSISDDPHFHYPHYYYRESSVSSSDIDVHPPEFNVSK